MKIITLSRISTLGMSLGLIALSLASCSQQNSESDGVASAPGENTAAASSATSTPATADLDASTAMTGFSPRLSEPRIQPTTKDDPKLNATQVAMLESRSDINLYKTLVHHVELYNRWSPLGRVLLNASTLPARDREIVMLRMGWLCQAEYEWAQHARIASADNIGMSAEEIHRIAADPDSESWTDFERTLMDMVDELRYDTMISDATWEKLRAKYTVEETMDALFTAAQYQLVSMVLNSIGIQLDPNLEYRLPTDVPAPALASTPSSPRLSTPRVPPLAVADLSEEQREIAAGQINEDGSFLNLYATLINHPQLYGPRYLFGSYLLRDSGLPAKTRELIIMRTGYLIRAKYEWSHHVPIAKEAGLTDEEIARIAEGPEAEGWSEEYAAVLMAVDQLRREAFITDDVWQTLEKYYDAKQLVEIIYTSGGYTMTGLAINSFGIQVEPGYPAFPE